MAQEPTYYRLPFRAEDLFRENGQATACDLAESIAHNLMLLITTKPGENRYDPEYGNAVWMLEFENNTTEAEWEEAFRGSLLTAIAKYETRIVTPAIHVKTTYVEHSYKTRKFTEVKKKATVNIQARLTESGENYNFSTEIFLSPMSID
ncbi:GPW/gp25 family protein [Chitinophagaceae bacterium MMS25-I14]